MDWNPYLFWESKGKHLYNAATMQICRPFSFLRSANKRDPFFRLSAFMHISTRFSWRDSRKILNSVVLREIVEPFHFWLKSNNVTDTSREGIHTYTSTHIYLPTHHPIRKTKENHRLFIFYILHCFVRTRSTFYLLNKRHDVKIHAWLAVQLHELPALD